jgi:ERCC4-related helicase
MSADFDTFFRTASSTEANPSGKTPYDYQRRLAGGDAGRACESQLISIPTGLGKTSAVVPARSDP